MYIKDVLLDSEAVKYKSVFLGQNKYNFPSNKL